MQTTIGPRQTLAVWPQGCLLNFLLRRPNSTPYIVLMPPEMAMFGEAAMLESYRRRPPDFILLVSFDTAEYGLKPFGEGYARKLGDWLRANYRRIDAFGVVPFAEGQPGAVLMVRAGQATGSNRCRSLSKCRNRLSGDLGVKNVRVQVGAVGPAERAKLRIDSPHARTPSDRAGGRRLPSQRIRRPRSTSPSAPSSKRRRTR